MRKMNTLLGVIIAIEILLLKGNEMVFKIGVIGRVNIMQMYLKQIFFFTLGIILCLVVFVASYETAYEELTIIVEEYDEESVIPVEP